MKAGLDRGTVRRIYDAVPGTRRSSGRQRAGTAFHLSTAAIRLTGSWSSSLPRLHQKHGESSSGLRNWSGEVSLWRTTPLPSVIVAIWNRAWEAGFGRRPTMDFFQNRCRFAHTSIQRPCMVPNLPVFLKKIQLENSENAQFWRECAS